MTTAPPPRADVLAALTEAFDHVAPDERPACEEELRAAGLDPAVVAARCAALAAPARHLGASAPGDRTGAAAGARRRWWAIAAVLVGGIAVALLAGRTPPERLARTTVVPRSVVPPSPQRGQGAAATPNAAAPALGREPHADGGPMAAAPDADGPIAPVAESPADSAAIGRAASQLRGLLGREASVPAPIAAGLSSGAVAIREIAVPPETLGRLQSNAFASATLANADRYAVDRLTCRLTARDGGAAPERFGLPFPAVADDDERVAGCQIMWNVAAAYAAGGGHRGRAAVCAASAGGDQCSDLSFTSLSLFGRQSGPIPDADGLRAASVLEVDDRSDPMAGDFVLTLEMLDGATNRWFYVAPAVVAEREVVLLGHKRRLPRESLQPDPSLTGLMFAARQRDCFDANPEAFAWTLIGKQTILAPLSGEGLSLAPPASDAAATPAARETLTVMRRPVWVVAAAERGSAAAGNRLVLYIDRELYRPYWKTEYVGRTLVASYACGAAWTVDGDIVAPLTSSVVRFDADGAPTARFTPYGEVLDQNLRAGELTIKMMLGD